MKKVKYLLLLLICFFIGYFPISVNAAQQAIDHVELREKSSSSTKYTCSALDEKIFYTDEITNSIGHLRIYLTDSDKYKVTSAYTNTKKASKIVNNTENPLLWKVDFSTSGSVFYIDIQNKESLDTQTYIVVVKSIEKATGPVLVDSSNNTIVGKNSDYQDGKSNIKKIDDCKDNEVYLKCEKVDPGYTVYSKETGPRWIHTDDNYYRVNGSKEYQYDATQKEENPVLAPVQLKKGWNVIEAYSEGTLPDFGEATGLKVGDLRGERSGYSDYLWFIYYDGEKEALPSDDTSLGKIRAVSYVNKYNEFFSGYSTQVDSKNDNYAIILPKVLKYPYILVQVSAKTSTSTVSMPSSMVKASCGSIYSIKVEPEKTVAIPVTVTAASGSSKVQNIEIKWLSSDANIKEANLTNGQLEKSINSEESAYFYTVSGQADTIFKVKASEGASLTFNGESADLKDGYYIYNAPADVSCVNVVVTAADGVSKKTYTFVNNTVGTYFTVSDETRKLAKELLEKSKWYKESADSPTDRYWSVFMRAAAGLSFDNIQVFDVTKASIDPTVPAKTYGAIILDLVITGENPYDFNGTNYVELLEKCSEPYGNQSFGPYGADIWAYIGLKAAGAGKDYKYMDALTTRVKNYALDPTGYLEMRSWAWAALGDELTYDQKISIIHEVDDTFFWKKGEDAGLFVAPEYQNCINSNCHGCVMTGINSMSYDIENYKTDATHSPLQSLYSRFYSDGVWLYRVGWKDGNDEKDVIIALGEVASGSSSIYGRYAPKNEDLNKLLSIAKDLLKTGSKVNNKALQEAYDAANLVKSESTGFGKEYYSLYSAIAAIDPGKVSKPNARMCSKADGKKIDEVIELIDNLKKEYTFEDLQNKDAYNEALQAYNSLEKTYYKSYVTNSDKLFKVGDTLEALENAQKVIAMIENLPEEITLADKESVEEIKEKYDELEEYKAYVGEENAKKIADAYSRIHILSFIDASNALCDVDKITLNDKETVEKLKKEFEALTKEEQDYLKENNADLVKKLEDAQAAIKKLEEAANAIKKGDKILVGSFRYQVTNISTKNATVKFIGAKTTALTNITIPATIKYKDKTYKITEIADASCKNYGKLKSIVIGTNVTTIGKNAFYACKNLTSIEVKATALKKVGANALKGINKNAVIKVPSKKLQAYKTLFNNKGQNNTVSVRGDGEVLIGQYYYKVTSAGLIFTGAKNSALTKLTIPSSLKYKGKSYKVTQIAEGALKNYTKLKSVVIGKNLTTIGKEAFASCKNLTLINIQSTLLKKVGAKALSGINKKAVIKVPAKKLKTYKILLSNKGQSKTVKVK